MLVLTPIVHNMASLTEPILAVKGKLSIYKIVIDDFVPETFRSNDCNWLLWYPPNVTGVLRECKNDVKSSKLGLISHQIAS
jgi:hypothetical protein